MKVSKDLLNFVKQDNCPYMEPVVMCTADYVDVFSALNAPDDSWVKLGTLDDLTDWMFENVSRECYEESEFEHQIIRFAVEESDLPFEKRAYTIVLKPMVGVALDDFEEMLEQDERIKEIHRVW